MLAEVKERCLQVFDACDSSEGFPGNGLDLVLAEVSAHGEVTCQKPKTHLINSAQIITNIRGEQALGVEGGRGRRRRRMGGYDIYDQWNNLV